MTDDDRAAIRRIADLLIRECGDQAAIFAKHRGLRARARGEPLKAEVWRMIADAAEEALLCSAGGRRHRAAAAAGGGRRRRDPTPVARASS